MALPGTVVVEAGYRNQVTVAPGTQVLAVYPNPIIRFGLRGRNEVLLSPAVYTQRSGADPVTGSVPAVGMQDPGFGFKHLLHDDSWRQDAINVFVTLPNGYPSGPVGFTAGAPTYTFGYSVVFALTNRIGVSTTQNYVLNATESSTGVERYGAYQPALSASYALSPNFTSMVQDQLTIPAAPGGGTGNRGLVGIQCTVSSNIVLDGEFEVNVLPHPGLAQHAVDVGITLLL